MKQTLGSRLRHAWNAFRNRDPTINNSDLGVSYFYRPDRIRLTRGNERSIVTSIFNRIALDASSVNIKHCKLDENERFVSVVDSGLNSCLNLEANIDQTGRAFMQDIVMSMLDEGCVAIVPTDTSFDPNITSSYDILSMRTGKIIEWYPEHVKVRVYNEHTGKKEDLKFTPEKEDMLDKIMNKDYKFKNNVDMVNNYYGLCYIIVKVINHDEK